MWVWAQASGRMYQDVGGKLVPLAKGYSGNGRSENNPDDQCVEDHGPLPRGKYAFGSLIPFNNMPDCLRLVPDPANAMCGRSGFLIHDGVSSGPHGQTSEGCICIPRAARINMARSGDSVLQVIRDEGSHASALTGFAAASLRSAARINAVAPSVQASESAFESLVPGGYFSADPEDMSLPRSVRCNNPGALNVSDWQRSRPGFAGVSQSDGKGNVTTVYRTPEHGIAAWYHLLAHVYRFAPGQEFTVRNLARAYAGAGAEQSVLDAYVAGWTRLSNGEIGEDTALDTGSTTQMLALGRSMFWHEAGEPTPLHKDQIEYGIVAERSGVLPP